MECCLCFDLFDLSKRRPKSQPCGHTVCLCCLLQLKDKCCPLCQLKWNGPASLFPDNFYLIGMLEQKQKAPLWAWCLDCRATPSPGCIDEHSVRSAKAALRLRLKDLLPRLAKELEALQELPAALNEEQTRAALSLLGALARPAAACEVRLAVEDGGGAEGQLAARCKLAAAGEDEDPLLAVLVLALAAKGGLRHQEEEAKAKKLAKQQGMLAGGQDSPAAETAHLAGISVQTLSAQAAQAQAPYSEQKTYLVERVVKKGCLLLEYVDCKADPAWCLRLLQAAGPLLEELSVRFCTWEHLAAVSAMPRLRRLHVYGDSPGGPAPAAAPAPPTQGRRGLQFLRLDGVQGLARDSLAFLLKVFGPGLEQMVLAVGTPGDGRGSCDNLHALLAPWDLASLRRLVLLRSGGSAFHVEGFCHDQLDAVRRVVPRAAVYCSLCHKINETFEVAAIKIQETL